MLSANGLYASNTRYMKHLVVIVVNTSPVLCLDNSARGCFPVAFPKTADYTYNRREFEAKKVYGCYPSCIRGEDDDEIPGEEYQER